MESPICTVPELTRIVRFVGDHISIKVRIGFSLFQKWHRLVHLDLLRMVRYVRDFHHMRSKKRPGTVSLVISEDIQDNILWILL